MARQERLTAAGPAARRSADEWAIIPGAAIPLLALVLAGLPRRRARNAVNVAHLGVRGRIVVLEIGAGIHAGARGTELVLDAAVGAILGGAILALKAILS